MEQSRSSWSIYFLFFIWESARGLTRSTLPRDPSPSQRPYHKVSDHGSLYLSFCFSVFWFPLCWFLDVTISRVVVWHGLFVDDYWKSVTHELNRDKKQFRQHFSWKLVRPSYGLRTTTAASASWQDLPTIWPFVVLLHRLGHIQSPLALTCTSVQVVKSR